MNDQNENSVLLEILRRGYRTLFFENWPLWLGALLIGIMSIITFAWARPWGVAGGLRNWGARMDRTNIMARLINSKVVVLAFIKLVSVSWMVCLKFTEVS